MSIPKQILEAAEKFWNNQNDEIDTSNDRACFDSGVEWLFQHLTELSEQSGLTSYWSDEKRRYDADAVDVILASDMAALLKANSRIKELEAALEFYADKNNWQRIEGHTKWASNLKIEDCALFNCGGGRARKALKANAIARGG